MTMSYEAWRASFQSSEQAARAAYAAAVKHAAECDALAAHVDLMRPALEDFARGLGTCRCGEPMESHSFDSGHNPVDSGWYAIDQYMGQGPAHSLARRDAWIKADALDLADALIPIKHAGARKVVREMAAAYRCKAEGSDS